MLNESCSVYERYANTPSETAQNFYYYPQWAGRFVCRKDFYIERSSYDSILLIYTVCGKGTLNYRRNEYTLTPHSIAIINCTELHSYYPCGDREWEFLFIHFRGNGIFELYEHIYGLSGGAVFCDCTVLHDTVADSIDLLRNRPYAYELSISKNISDILYRLIYRIGKDERGKVLQVCDYIAANYAQDISTHKLSEISCLSRCYFSVVFKKIIGTTPHDYLLCCRINKAKLLLLENTRSISEIAEITGFRDVGTFIRAFKKKENMTPLKYKKSFEKNTKK